MRIVPMGETLSPISERSQYIPLAFAADIVESNRRNTSDKLKALRFLTPDGLPTLTGILALGKDPRDFIPSAYIQFTRFDSTKLSDAIRDQKEIDGPLFEILRKTDEILVANNAVATSLTQGEIEIQKPEYPIPALQQLVRNAIMHRNYDGTNAPVRIYWFSDRIEIHNPGGPYGQVTRENFGHPGITDYRNPHIAEVMKTLGYVQRFGVGIQIARSQLSTNGNPQLEFIVEDTYVAAVVRRAT